MTAELAATKKKYTITRCGESWEFSNWQSASLYGQKLTTVYGAGSPSDGTAVFLWTEGKDEPTRIYRGRRVYRAYPEA